MQVQPVRSNPRKELQIDALVPHKLVLGNPPPAPDLVPTITLVAAAFTSTFSACVSWFPAMLLCSWNTAVAKAAIQQGVVYSTYHSPCGWWRSKAAVILCSSLIFVLSLYILRDLVQLLIKSRNPFLHRFYCLGHCELHIIHDLLKSKTASCKRRGNMNYNHKIKTARA